ncbi:MAG: efflux RND transporter permease subunit [Alphaproteobacteria bacterium]|uniref:Multidrug resistance protein MdtC n=1 Tax=Brevundimonas mediterranea TaxID=74329 RepID=A0A7Z9C5F9_9CAUL|nr:efflux RND transporter permease subunit [Brevundimonas mediterranea]MBU1272743.1 efflux RND transporter permease subunit [Alphaproteobacteria bacterium]OGN45277.1 MAG: acriflavine resistance protein B [Caulobacterales bacterium GWE1_67_11]MBU1519842.1 efflux RND transporter permease subunit [Alphaproteobacteria bacterium]MBU2030167.1 efflux RND transporter permease subunit [Alphaproteobacteria bacterium]MBU2164764.1 efflux RND transporter permease subunit [Alphaproteobacteria bacterium]
MNQISSWAIKNPIPIILLFLLLTLGGVVGFMGMRINSNPDIDFPLVNVTAARPGSAPAEMEVQVTRLIEDSLAGLSGVRHITSNISDGVSTTVIEFELGTDTDRATNDVRNAMTGLRASLPQDMQEPGVQRIDITGDALITYVVRSPTMTPEQISWFIDNEMSRALLALGGVGQVNRSGGVDREMRVELDPQRLAAYGVTAAEVSQALTNVNNNLPGGRVTIAGSERAVRTLGAATSVAQLRETLVPLGEGKTVRLDNLGTVEDKWSEPRRLARYNGQEAVTFNFLRSRTASEVKVAEKVREEVKKIDEAHPELTISQVTASVEEIEESYLASLEALLLGAVLAVIIVFIFLRDWRATLIAATAMPMSLIPTFAILGPLDQSLNVVTLLALSLTIGILVDDAIVEIENIVRHMRDGKPPYDASLEAADEIGLAVVATTATIIAVFAPVGFMPGIIGQFFKAFALAACVSVAFSLLVARTLTPLMAAFILKHSHHEDRDPFWMGGYLKALHWCLGNRWKVFIIGILFLVGSIATSIVAKMSFEFMSPGDTARAAFQVELPPGSTLRQTDAVVQQITRKLEARPEVTSVYAAVGGQDVTQANIYADMVPKGDRELSQQAFARVMVDEMKQIPGARIRAGISQQGGGPGDGTTYTFSILSDDPVALNAAARKVEEEMRGVSGLANVVNSAAIARPEILVTPRPDEAALAGVSAGAISQAVRVATIGDVDQNLPKYNLGDRQIPIRLQLTEAAREDLSVLENLRVPATGGASVPLSAVADIQFGAGPATVTRQDRSRIASISAELDGITTGAASVAVNRLPSVQNLPAGVRQVPAGDEEFIQEMLTGFGIAFASGILLMYAVLTLLFKSFAYPITIMAALPLAIGGAFIALAIGGANFSMSALIGVLMLMGIAAKNSILLVDYVIMAEKDGMPRREAIMDAAHKRARPILMTTFAMGAGMVPIAMGIGADVQFRSPMAIAVLGGLISSTFLSLLYIPAIFTIVDDVAQWARRILRRSTAGQRELAKPRQAPLVE